MQRHQLINRPIPATSQAYRLPLAVTVCEELEAHTQRETLRLDPTTLSGLPSPARRFLQHALPQGTPLSAAVELGMEGAIKLGPRWFPFSASQILRAGVGFVWEPVVGGRFIRFLGADILGSQGALMEFRLHGRIPIVKAAGPDTTKSAAGRLAAETVAWLPQTLTPQAGATWTAIDDETATVTIPTPSGDIDVDIKVAVDGTLESMNLQRWNDSAKPPRHEAFGGTVSSDHVTTSGVRIAGSGTVGWGWDTTERDDHLFFRYTITHAQHLSLSAQDAAA